MKLIGFQDEYIIIHIFQDTNTMDDGEDGVSIAWDLNSIKEEEFERLAVYLVPDQPPQPDNPNRAESTLPRNLVLKPSQALSDVSTIHYVNTVYCK